MRRIKRSTVLQGMVFTLVLIAGITVAGCMKQTQKAKQNLGAIPPVDSTSRDISLDRATFDFYVDHKVRLVASTANASERETVFDIIINPISSSNEPIRIQAIPVNVQKGFRIILDSEELFLKDSGQTVSCRVVAPMSVVEDTEALFKVVGTRGKETEELRLKVKVLSASPKFYPGKSDTKVEEQLLKVTAGETLRYRLSLANQGHISDRFDLAVEVPADWTARLTDDSGNEIKDVKVKPVHGIFQWEYPEKIWLEVKPGSDAPKKRINLFTVSAKSRVSGRTDNITVKAFYSEFLFSVNDLDGLDPRLHYLKADAKTSYVLHLLNPDNEKKSFSLKTENLPADWKIDIPGTPVTVPGEGMEKVTVIVQAPVSALPHKSAVFRVTADSPEGMVLGTVRLEARVTDIPKIYMFVIDSLDYQYTTLNKKGEGPGKEGDWLCPNIRKFMKLGTSFSQAHCGMPSATDMNHTTIMSGANTGTLGAYWVSAYFNGLDDVDDIKLVRPNSDVLRYGAEGKPLPRIFDLVKERYPMARSVVLSNKAWVSNLHEDGNSVKWGVTGSHFPVYASSPPAYVLGDPPTDENPDDRAPVMPRDMITNANVGKFLTQVFAGDFFMLKPLTQDVGEYIGAKPGFFPDDKWFADTACQIIREEDPDVLYVNLAAVDEAGHVFGAAWDPEEWKESKGFLTGTHWESKYSEQARLDDSLDVVREADYRFGQIVNEIESRGLLDNSIIVFTSDHSMITAGHTKQGYAALDIKEYLRSQGLISPKHYQTAWGLNHWAAIFGVRDEQTRYEIERLLQGMTVDDPIEGKGFHPYMVLDREEMKTGTDSDNPFLAEQEKHVTDPLELYSEYYIEHATDIISWPDLAIFLRGRYQVTTPGDSLIRGVNGVGEKLPVFPENGNRLVGMHGSVGATHVPIVLAGPGIKNNFEVNKPAKLHDIMPTIFHLLGWEIPETADGKIRSEVFNK